MQIAMLSIQMAEKIIAEKISDTGKQNDLIEKYLKDIRLN
jgi:F0F1-type ATP synthase membrane subunit b/b'